MSITHETVERAAREVVEVTTGFAVRGATHHREADGAFAEVVGTLSLLGTRGGTLVVYCTWARASAIAAGMLGPSDTPYDDDTVRDAMGEVVNQIGGTIKRTVAASGAEMLLSPPVVVTGSPLSHRVKSSANPIRVDLDVDPESDPICVCVWPS